MAEHSQPKAMAPATDNTIHPVFLPTFMFPPLTFLPLNAYPTFGYRTPNNLDSAT